MAKFLAGLDLSERLYAEVVAPMLGNDFPAVAHAAALIGWGSEVLGYDDPISTDHNWGPRLQFFLSRPDLEQFGAAMMARLDERMPATLHGRPTRFAVRVPDHQRGRADSSLIAESHQIEIHTVPGFFGVYLGCQPEAELGPVDWLLLSEHRLLTVTRGRVFHDQTGALRRAREAFAYYPDEVWRYLLAVQWARLGEEEAFVGRSGDAGDELGSRMIAARQVRLMVHLCFLMARRYAPYSKWLGRAFSELSCAPELGPLFDEILAAQSWRERERFLADAYERLARMHNALQLTPPLAAQTRAYHERPYRVLFAGRFAEALLETVRDPTLRALPEQLGSINQFVAAGINEAPPFARLVRRIYA